MIRSSPHSASSSRPIWPPDQKLEKWLDPSVLLTQFGDTDSYHSELTQRVLELEEDEKLSKNWGSFVGATKVYHLEKWNSPAASLIHHRALTLFKAVFRTNQVFVDLSWATIYRDGDYCLPHSHFRTMASIVYILDLGDADPEDSSNGRFLFTDPRMPVCCRNEAERMTTPCAPILHAGTMIMFPGQAVHFVTPYRGERERITLSWNLNRKALPGSPFLDVKTAPAK